MKITVFSSDVEEILDGDNRTVSMYLIALDEIVEVTMKQCYMSFDDGVKLLIDKLKRHNNIEVEYLTDTTLVLQHAHKDGSNVSLTFKDTETNKLHEVNFTGATDVSLMQFIDNHYSRLTDMFKGALNKDVIKFMF